MLLCYGYSNAIQWLDKYTGAAGHAAPFVPHNMQVSGHPGIEQTSAELCETEDCSDGAVKGGPDSNGSCFRWGHPLKWVIGVAGLDGVTRGLGCQV